MPVGDIDRRIRLAAALFRFNGHIPPNAQRWVDGDPNIHGDEVAALAALLAEHRAEARNEAVAQALRAIDDRLEHGDMRVPLRDRWRESDWTRGMMAARRKVAALAKVKETA